MPVFFKILLFPLSVLYGIIACIRNKLYDWKILPSKSFPLPVICIGNLTTGGTGKTPLVEYLIRLLKKNYSVATLSRGYKRKSKGFILADKYSTVENIGDEPVLFFKKFKNITVAVDSDRCNGINNLLSDENGIDVILLDDAFQHRTVNPGLSILLTDYHNLYIKDHPLPSGNLREFRCNSKRADIIIVTKTPKVFSPITRRRLVEEINPKPYQKLFFSYIEFSALKPFNRNNEKIEKDKFYSILLFCGIANSYPLEEQLRRICTDLEIVKFSDHHYYTKDDMLRIKAKFDNIPSKNKIMVTTEKDIVRLKNPDLKKIIKDLPVFYIPIKVEFHEKDKLEFNRVINEYLMLHRNEINIENIQYKTNCYL